MRALAPLSKATPHRRLSRARMEALQSSPRLSRLRALRSPLRREKSRTAMTSTLSSTSRSSMAVQLAERRRHLSPRKRISRRPLERRALALAPQTTKPLSILVAVVVAVALTKRSANPLALRSTLTHLMMCIRRSPSRALRFLALPPPKGMGTLILTLSLTLRSTSEVVALPIVLTLKPPLPLSRVLLLAMGHLHRLPPVPRPRPRRPPGAHPARVAPTAPPSAWTPLRLHARPPPTPATMPRAPLLCTSVMTLASTPRSARLSTMEATNLALAHTDLPTRSRPPPARRPPQRRVERA